jgi:phospholipid transport system substrate-binding protein
MLSRRSLLMLSAALLACLAVPQARADDSSANAFVRSFGDTLIGIVNSPGSAADKQRRLAPVIERGVDVDVIAQFCLGRFWRTATPAQQKQYVDLFHGVLINNIVGHLGEYRGVSYTMTSTQDRGGEAYVGTVIHRPSATDVAVQWVVGQGGGHDRIVDVVAEGTSLRLTQRSDYASFLSRNNNDLDALISAMRRQVEPG